VVQLKEFEEKLKKYLMTNKIDAQQYVFVNICHSVDEAAAAANASPRIL
jgi:hypothetical protein